MNYVDPILKKYADLIQSETNQFKAVYFADPIRVPVSKLPALIISKRATDASPSSNAEDEHKIGIVITVIADIRHETKLDGNSIAPGVASLYDIMEGRNDDLTLKPESLLYIIRHNVDVGVSQQIYTDIRTATKVDYGMTMGKRAENSYGIEATLTLVANFIQFR